jgi:hypothetical protein
MNHPAVTPRQTSHCLFGINIGNHNETLIAARPPRRSGLYLGNHNETLITRRSGLSENHNETLITSRPSRRSGLDTNHNETLITARPAGAALNHGEALIVDGRAWPHPEYRIPVTAALVR